MDARTLRDLNPDVARSDVEGGGKLKLGTWLRVHAHVSDEWLRSLQASSGVAADEETGVCSKRRRCRAGTEMAGVGEGEREGPYLEGPQGLAWSLSTLSKEERSLSSTADLEDHLAENERTIPEMKRKIAALEQDRRQLNWMRLETTTQQALETKVKDNFARHVFI